MLERSRKRLNNRWPLIGGWLRRRAARALVAQGSPEALLILARALAGHFDPDVRQIARGLFEQRADTPAIDALAQAWFEARGPDLAYLLGQHGSLPTGPPEVRALVALKLGWPGEAAVVGAPGVPA